MCRPHGQTWSRAGKNKMGGYGRRHGCCEEKVSASWCIIRGATHARGDWLVARPLFICPMRMMTTSPMPEYPHDHIIGARSGHVPCGLVTERGGATTAKYLKAWTLIQHVVVACGEGVGKLISKRGWSMNELGHESWWEPYTVADGRFKRSGSGSDPFRTGSQNPLGSGPRTGPMVRFFPCPEPWTGPWSGSAGFRFEPQFWTEPYHPYASSLPLPSAGPQACWGRCPQTPIHLLNSTPSLLVS